MFWLFFFSLKNLKIINILFENALIETNYINIYVSGYYRYLVNCRFQNVPKVAQSIRLYRFRRGQYCRIMPDGYYVFIMPGAHHSLIMPGVHYKRTLSGFNVEKIRHKFLIIFVKRGIIYISNTSRGDVWCRSRYS